jgi:hypothetical protein
MHAVMRIKELTPLSAPTKAKLCNEPGEPSVTLSLTLGASRTAGRVERKSGKYVGTIRLDSTATDDLVSYGEDGVVNFIWSADDLVTSVIVETPL